MSHVLIHKIIKYKNKCSNFTAKALFEGMDIIQDIISGIGLFDEWKNERSEFLSIDVFRVNNDSKSFQNIQGHN